MEDTTLNSDLLQSGKIFESTVTSIKKATPNHSGNKIADISNIEIGSINLSLIHIWFSKTSRKQT